jgi:thymidine phosphorylase
MSSEITNHATGTLSLRRVGIDTYHENVAYLHRDCAIYRAEGFQALSKVEVRANGQRILATLNVVDDERIVGCDELGVSEDAFAQLQVPDGHLATVSQAEPPESIPALFRKINGERLGREDFQAIVRDIADLRYSKIELTAFVVACNRSELDREEVYFLTEAMVASGRRLDWHEPLVVDKHCIGGIPGNRTSMLVVPIVAAYGLVFSQDLVAGHHLARRHGRHYGGARQRRTAVRPPDRDRSSPPGMPGLGRYG